VHHCYHDAGVYLAGRLCLNDAVSLQLMQPLNNSTQSSIHRVHICCVRRRIIGSSIEEYYYIDSVLVKLGIQTFFSTYAKLYSLKNLSPSVANYRLGLAKRLGFMSGLTLPAAVGRGRHRNPTANHAECLRVTVTGSR